jgi:hypothetical protein
MQGGKQMTSFSVVWDNSHPDSKGCADRIEVDKLLNDLMTECELEEWPHYNIWVYEGEKDVTDRFLALNPGRSMVRDIAQEKQISEDVLSEVNK